MIFIINYLVKYIICYENGFYRRTANISVETVVRQRHARSRTVRPPAGGTPYTHRRTVEHFAENLLEF